MKKSHLWRRIEGRNWEYQATEPIENLKDGKLVKGLVEEILNDEEHERLPRTVKRKFFFFAKRNICKSTFANLFEHVYLNTVKDKAFLLFVERIYVKNVVCHSKTDAWTSSDHFLSELIELEHDWSWREQWQYTPEIMQVKELLWQ
jgi:hypothetical protein